MKPFQIIPLVLAAMSVTHAIAQNIPADDVANALDSLKIQAVTKIDQDLEANARAFADAKNIQVSARWSDWFSPFLDIARAVYDGLTTISIKKPTSVRSWVKTSLQAVDSGKKIFSLATSFDRFWQDGQNLQLAIDGPAYNSAVTTMLDRAEDAGFPLHLIFDYDSYRYSILNDLNGIAGWSPLRVVHKTSTADRSGGEVLPTVYAAKNHIFDQLKALSTEMRQRQLPPATISQIAEFVEARRSDLLNARVSNTQVSYSAYLLKDGSPILCPVSYSLGSVAALARWRATMLGAYADNVDIEMRVRLAETADTGLSQAADLLTEQVNLNLSVEAVIAGQVEANEILKNASSLGFSFAKPEVGSLLNLSRSFASNAREQINMIPQEMMDILPGEVSKVLVLVDDTIQQVRALADPPSVAPTIDKVEPAQLQPLPSPQTQTLHIYGSGFTSSSTLVFTHGASVFNSVPARLHFQNATQIDYDIIVDGGVGTWSVKVVYGSQESNLEYFTVTPMPTVARPTISPFGGSSTGPVQVTLGCDTVGVQIHYTLNGNDPTTSDTAYTGPFTLTSSATVKARAFLTGYNPSPVIAASFTVASVPGTVAITIATTPPGLLVSVDDGAATPAPVTVNRTPGQTLNVNSPSPQVSSDGHTRYNFASWSDGGTQAHTVITPSADRTYTATFAPQYQLAITVSPPGSGNVTATPSAAWYNPGQPVSLVAQAASGNSFSSWSGVDSQSGDAAQVTMNGYRGVTASFSTNSSGAGSIRVSIVPQAAADQGAQWKLTSESQWHSSGAITTVSSLGDYIVQFKIISGWTTPPNKTIALFPAQTDVWIDSDPYLQQGPGDAPTVTTLAANSISAFTGTMNGTVNGNGWATTAWFEWSTDPTLATFTSTPSQAIGPNEMPVSATLIQLVPDTPYYFRVAASNPQGTARGSILSFTTLAQTPSSIFTWGDSSDGQRNVPADLSDIVAVAAGGFHALALSGEGKVSAWGLGSDGQTSVPTDLQNVVAVSAGLRHSVALRADGSVTVWGGNDLGQRNVPGGLSGAVAIVASSYHTLALKNDGTVVGWGRNDSGQSSPPPGLSGVIAIAAGDFHSLALKRDGTIVGWGSDADGELDIPPGLDDVVGIAASVGYSLALRNDGTVVAWGFNGYGETSIPPSLNDVVSIAAGAYHCLALKRDGTVVAWGRDVSGQIDVPPGLPTVGGISAGNSFSMALANASPPVIIQQPQSATISPGGTVLFKVSAVCAVPLTYQWRLNGTDLPGETSSTLLLSSAKVTNSGSYSVAVTGLAGTRMSAAALLQVTASPFTVLWANPPDITYGVALSPAQLNATASIPGGFTYNPTAGAVLPAGNAQLLTATFTPSDTTTYQSTTATVTINVLKATLAVAASDSNRPYGTPNPDFSGAITGVQNGDNITATYACSATPGSPVGTYSISPTVHDPDGKLGNYALSTANGTLTVTPAALVVSTSNAGRTYGAANPVFTGTVTGVQNGDNITANYSCSATFTSPVGQYAIVPTLSDPGGKLGNYSVTLNNGALSVSPAPLIVTADNENRAYGTPNPSFTGIVDGVQNGDNFTASFFCSATPTGPVGNYLIIPSLNDPGGSLGNYNVTLNNGILTVTQAPAAVTLNPATLTQVYDGMPKVVVADTTPSGLAVTFTYSDNLTPPTAAGNYAVIATVNDANYTGSASGTLKVSRVALTVTGITAANKPYDGTIIATITGTPTLVGVIGGDAVTITGTPVGTFENKNVGNNKPVTVTGLSWGGANAGNYMLSVPALSASITPAPLVVTADNKTRAFGTANPPLTGTVTGLQTGDPITATYNCTATTTSPAGSYPIVPILVDPANDLANYNVTLNNGTLTITPLELKLAGLAFDSRHFGLSIATEAGLKYTLEYTVSLTAPVWAPVKTVTGNGSVLSLDDANASDAARFYRVRVEPQGP